MTWVFFAFAWVLVQSVSEVFKAVTVGDKSLPAVLCWNGSLLFALLKITEVI